jgi:hypothetical protein
MFKKRTVFIIWAGASCECGLPLGSELKDRVADRLKLRFDYRRLLSGDPNLFEALTRRFGNRDELNRYIQAANELASVVTTFISIDDTRYLSSDFDDQRRGCQLSISNSSDNPEDV